MDEETSWRDLLREIISDPMEKQRLVDALNINPVTLTRWVAGQSSPRQDKLQYLLKALPTHRERLSALLKREFPYFVLDVVSQDQQPQEIPSEFYERVVRAYATGLPGQASVVIQEMLLQQVRDQLDGARQGIAVFFMKCLKPREGNKVRSLCMVMGRGATPWQNIYDNHAALMGAEAQTGDAARGHYITIRNREERLRMYPTHYDGIAESSIAYPVQQADRVAGCLLILSTLPDYFSPARVDLVHAYADLASLAFCEDEFYPLDEIQLGVMPPPSEQQPYLEKFHRRVWQCMRQASQRNEVLRKPDAELRVWQEIEEQLLQS